jgi:hypothetical protein
MTKKQHNTPNVTVGTVKKSMAAMASRWLRRKASQRLAGSGSLALAPSIEKSFARRFETEHQQLSMNARRSPRWILRHHSEDQLPNFLRRPPFSDRFPHFRDHSPIQTEADSMPSDNGFRGDDEEQLLPLRPEPTNSNPEEFVEQIEIWPRTAPFQHGQLLTEYEILEDEIPARPRNRPRAPRTKGRTSRTWLGVITDCLRNAGCTLLILRPVSILASDNRSNLTSSIRTEFLVRTGVGAPTNFLHWAPTD